MDLGLLDRDTPLVRVNDYEELLQEKTLLGFTTTAAKAKRSAANAAFGADLFSASTRLLEEAIDILNLLNSDSYTGSPEAYSIIADVSTGTPATLSGVGVDNYSITFKKDGTLGHIEQSGTTFSCNCFRGGFYVYDAEQAAQEVMVGSATKVGDNIELSVTATTLECSLTGRVGVVGSHIRLSGHLSDDSASSTRALLLNLKLPMYASGWTWHNSISQGITIPEDPTIIQCSRPFQYGDQSECSERLMSVYPIGCVSNDSNGTVVGVDLGLPVAHVIRFDTRDKSLNVIQECGITNDHDYLSGKSEFQFMTYGLDLPEWGFRDAFRKLYTMYPDKYWSSSTLQNEDEGLWSPKAIADGMSTAETDVHIFSAMGFTVIQGDQYAGSLMAPIFGAIPLKYKRIDSHNDDPIAPTFQYGTAMTWSNIESMTATSVCVDTNGDPIVDVENDFFVMNASLTHSGTSDPTDWDNMCYGQLIISGSITDAKQLYMVDEGYSKWGMFHDVVGKRGQAEDFSADHIRVYDNPLQFNYTDFKPVVMQLMTDPSYLHAQHAFMKNGNNDGIITLNSSPLSWNMAFLLPYVDTFGDEHVPYLDEMHYRRSLGPYKNHAMKSKSHNDYTLAQMLYYGSYSVEFSGSVEDTTTEERIQYFRSISAITSGYVANTRVLNAAKWHPVTYATTDDEDILIERWGAVDDAAIYFTVHNKIWQHGATTFAVTIDSDKFDTKFDTYHDMINNTAVDIGAISLTGKETKMIRCTA